MEEFTAVVKAFARDELIAITLEDCPETFTVSKALLCSTSDYFVKALEGNFVEAQTRTLKMPGCSVETFELFLFYAVNGCLPDFVASVMEVEEGTDRVLVKGQSLLRLVRVWGFGDRFLVPALQNKAMKCMLQLLVASPGFYSAAVDLAFELTSGDSLICKMAVKVCVWCYTDSRFRYSPDAMERLAAIPGFFQLFAEALKTHYVEELTIDDYPHTEKNHKDYMVVETPGKVG